MRKLLPKLILSLLIGAVFAWLAQRGGVPLLPSRAAFRHVQLWAVPAYVAVVLAAHWLRATRWRLLIRPIRSLSLREVVSLNWIGFFAIFVMPLRLGEFVRPALTRVRHRVPISAGIGTVAVERVIDGLITSLLVAWAIVTLPRRATDDPIARHVPLYGSISLAVFAGALVFLALFLWQRLLAVRLMHATVGRFSPHLASRLGEQIHHVADGLRSLTHMRLAFGFVGESLLYWTANIAGLWMLALGCGLPLTFGQAVAVNGILALGILLPTGPGLFGNFQLALVTAFRLFLPAHMIAEQGGVTIFLLYVVQAAVVLSTGTAALLASHTSLSGLMPDDAEAAAALQPDKPSAAA